MTRIIDVHIHVGHRFEWTGTAKTIWMDTRPYVPQIYDDQERQLPKEYGEVLKREGVSGGRGFWYHIAEFLVKSFKNVYIDVSGLPPINLLNYFPP